MACPVTRRETSSESEGPAGCDWHGKAERHWTIPPLHFEVADPVPPRETSSESEGPVGCDWEGTIEHFLCIAICI